MDYDIQLALRRRNDFDKGARYMLILRSPMSGGSYDLTKEYADADTCLRAFASWVRKQTVEAEGEDPPLPEA